MVSRLAYLCATESRALPPLLDIKNIYILLCIWLTSFSNSFVGSWNQESLRVFVLIPLLVYLAIGFIFLSTGFISLWRIRTVMKLDGTKTDKLEKLMMRIGFFSVLYVCPTTILLACYYYEYTNLDMWITSWLGDICQNHDYGISCPLSMLEKRTHKPYFSIFLLKYTATLMAGITSGFWMWSEKTFTSWMNFYLKICRTLCCIKGSRKETKTYV